MSQQTLLIRAVEALEGAGVPYMITGSTASSIQGEPRSTHDIDLVVDLAAASITDLAANFPAHDYYLSVSAIRDALAAGSMFNLLDITNGDKVDFWLLTDEPFDRSRFARRQFVEMFGKRFSVSSPEDTILAKLRWSQLSGGSQRQEHDARAVYELQYTRLDHTYLDEWAERLDLVGLLTRLRDRAEPWEEYRE